MKARVKATGEIVEVRLCGEWTNMHGDILPYRTNDGVEYSSHDLSFKIDDERGDPDYWTRLEHQAAIAAMQGMMNNSYLAGEFRKDPNNGIEDMSKIITKAAAVYAHALVEKMKEEK